MLTPQEAEERIAQHAPRLSTETRALTVLSGRVLAQSVMAERDSPPFDRVTMDGIALSSTSSARHYRITGTQAAGAPPLSIATPGDCIEVMTGATLPEGCDCVIPVERIVVKDGVATLAADVQTRHGLNVHRRAEDGAAHSLLLSAGTRLGPAEIAVVASAGLARVSVARVPRIIVISTGDELIEPGAPILDWQIRRSNVYGVLAGLRAHGFEELAEDHLPDNLDVLRTRLATHLDTHDVLILSGGVSMGRFDFIPQVLAELGVQMIFHKIAQRPGKPMWFGVRSDGKAVYALPGNPVSTLLCLRRYVIGGLLAAMGAAVSVTEQIALAREHEVKPALSFLLPVTLEAGQANPHPTRGSGDFISLLGTAGFVQLPPGPRIYPKGEMVELYRW
jgi:molybdopterin molybdotransferase